MERVSGESLLGKSYAAQIEPAARSEIEAEGTKKQTELEKLDTAIKALQDELREAGLGALAGGAPSRSSRRSCKKSRERQAFVEDGQPELQRMQRAGAGPGLTA